MHEQEEQRHRREGMKYKRINATVILALFACDSFTIVLPSFWPDDKIGFAVSDQTHATKVRKYVCVCFT